MTHEIVILGAGESGTGAALLAKAKGLSVFVSDAGQIRDAYKAELVAAGISFEEGGHTADIILGAREIIKSPGIPLKAEIVKHALDKGIPVIDELEFAFRYTNARCIGITGSNGKTTTTLLTYHLMQKCGFNVGLAGNIGTSLAKQVIEDKFDWYVLEISSFQLDGMFAFRNHIAILTNITPDHLDRYEYRFENYVDSKLRIIQNMVAGDVLIFNALDLVVAPKIKAMAPDFQLLTVGLEEEKSQIFKAGEVLRFRGTHYQFELPMAAIPLKGDHNMLNAMMAVAAVAEAGGKPVDILAGVADFENAPHRCEMVATINGVLFVNDSKATNVDSVKYAFSAFEGPIVWIAGGVDKGNDYTELDAAVQQKVAALICLGKENDKLRQHFGTMLATVSETQSVAAAVEMALQQAKPGTTVLLSPACASFDLFKNYEDRGNQYRAAVKMLETNVLLHKTSTTEA